MKLTIKGDKYVNTEDKNGNPFKTKDGKPYKKIAFKVHEEVLGTSGEYLSGFYRDSMENWGDGTVIEVDVEKNEKNGKTYLNFSLPRQTVSREEFDNLKLQVEQAFNLANLANKRLDQNEKTPIFDGAKSLADEVGLREEDLPF